MKKEKSRGKQPTPQIHYNYINYNHKMITERAKNYHKLDTDQQHQQMVTILRKI